MANEAYALSPDCVAITCCHEHCGLSFFVPQWWEQNRRKDHTWWYCPNGHPQHFSGMSDAERVRAELEQEKARHQYTRNQLQATTNIARKAKADKTKVLKRVAAGVCPFCKRSFAQLAAHMESQHPKERRALGMPCHPKET